MSGARKMTLTRLSDIKISATPTDLDVAKALILAGVPVFAARRAVDKAGEWTPDGGTNSCGYWLPPQWQQTIPSTQWLDGTTRGHYGRYGYRPGDALGAVMGHRLDLLDIDPRNWGDWDGLSATLPTNIVAAATTPSGGWHVFVAPLGVKSRDNVASGVDVKAGDLDGKGRGFAWIAPTVKLSKATGEVAPYVWITRPPAVLPTGPDGSGAALIALIESTRRKAAPAVVTGTTGTETAEQGRKALVGLLRVVLNADPGGRNSALNWAAYRAGEHVKAGGLDLEYTREWLEKCGAEVGLTEIRQ